MLKEENFEQHSVTWLDVSRLIRTHALLIIVVFACGVLGTWAILQVFFTDLYETKASLLVKVGRETSGAPPTVQNGQLLSQGVRIEDINSEVQLLSDPIFVAAAVDQFGPAAFQSKLARPVNAWGYPKYWAKLNARRIKAVYKEFLIEINIKPRLNPREEAILAVEDGLNVSPIKESDVLVLKLRLPSAHLAARVADFIVQAYLQRRAAVRHAPTGREFFEGQVSSYGSQLKELEEKRSAIRSTWGLSDPVEQRKILLGQLSGLESQMVQGHAQEVQLVSEQQALSDQLASLPKMVDKERVVSRNPSIASVKDRIAALQVERAKIAGRFLPDSESMAQIDGQIKDLQAVLGGEPENVTSSATTVVNPSAEDLGQKIEDVKAELAGLRAQIADLGKPAADIRGLLNGLNTGADSLADIQRDYAVTESQYLDYRKRLEEARMSDELDSRRLANVTVFSEPDVPIQPASPPKMFIMGISLPVSLLLAVVLAAIMESMEDRLRTPLDISSLNLTWLGELDAGNEIEFSPGGGNGASKNKTRRWSKVRR